MAEDLRQIYSFTVIICCNDALKGVSVGFDGRTLFKIVLFDFIKGWKCGSLFLGRGSQNFWWCPSSLGALSLSFTKVISSSWPRLFALSRDSSIRVVAMSLVTTFCNLSGIVTWLLMLKTFAWRSKTITFFSSELSRSFLDGLDSLHAIWSSLATWNIFVNTAICARRFYDSVHLHSAAVVLVMPTIPPPLFLVPLSHSWSWSGSSQLNCWEEPFTTQLSSDKEQKDADHVLPPVILLCLTEWTSRDFVSVHCPSLPNRPKVVAEAVVTSPEEWSCELKDLCCSLNLQVCTPQFMDLRNRSQSRCLVAQSLEILNLESWIKKFS